MSNDPMSTDGSFSPMRNHENKSRRNFFFMANDVKTLIKAGADINAIDADGCTPLHIAAAFSDSLDVVKTLLDAGADTMQ